MLTDYHSIERTGVNTFVLISKENGEKIKFIKQFIESPDYIIVIDDDEYLEGYITKEGKYSEKPINIPNEELQKAKDALLAN